VNKALFLDRDGVINIDSGYVYQQEKFIFINGIFELVKKANVRHYKVIIVTNQAGIGRGFYTEKDFWDLMNWVKDEFTKHDAIIDDIYFCPHHPEFGLVEYKQDSYDRKPNPGMFLKAQKKHNLDMSKSIMIGDKDVDMIAAMRAGIPHCFCLNNKIVFGDGKSISTFKEMMNFLI
jgi:D-glycero-D-manno-heptose 1,7-bisphosphate phosphatase